MYILISNTINHLLFCTLKSDFDGATWYFLGFKPDVFMVEVSANMYWTWEKRWVANLKKVRLLNPTFLRVENKPSFLKSESRVQIIRLLESCSWNNQALLYFHVRKRYMSCIRWLLAQATFSEPFLRPTEPSRQEVSWGS